MRNSGCDGISAWVPRHSVVCVSDIPRVLTSRRTWLSDGFWHGGADIDFFSQLMSNYIHILTRTIHSKVWCWYQMSVVRNWLGMCMHNIVLNGWLLAVFRSTSLIRNWVRLSTAEWWLVMYTDCKAHRCWCWISRIYFSLSVIIDGVKSKVMAVDHTIPILQCTCDCGIVFGQIFFDMLVVCVCKFSEIII